MIELTCYLYNKKLADLDIKTEDQEVLITIEKSEICAIRQLIEDEQETPSDVKCIIYLKNGESFWIKKNYKEMVNLRFK